MWGQQLCTIGGKTEGILVILRARESRNHRHSITVQRTCPFWDWKAQQAHLRKMMVTARGFSDPHLRCMRGHCRETDRTGSEKGESHTEDIPQGENFEEEESPDLGEWVGWEAKRGMEGWIPRETMNVNISKNTRQRAQSSAA